SGLRDVKDCVRTNSGEIVPMRGRIGGNVHQFAYPEHLHDKRWRISRRGWRGKQTPGPNEAVSCLACAISSLPLPSLTLSLALPRLQKARANLGLRKIASP